MMCVVTFFNQWLKTKLDMQKQATGLEYDENDPEPYWMRRSCTREAALEFQFACPTLPLDGLP